MTDQWECQVFAFILAISEVNAFLILRYFVYCRLCPEGIPTLLEFCQKLVWQLINNIYNREWEEGGELLSESIYLLMTTPRHARIYQNLRWICTEKITYQQYSCSFKCIKKIRNYCVCTPGVWIYSYYNVQHVFMASSDD